ncbi:short chain dehydrogenase/ reductase [Linnemannia elongata]|nr:short chain dehydrogenase/ reductase [Linnemannia elongata]
MTSTRRVALVTGSSRGIGRAIALRLAQDGFNIVVNYHSNVAKAQEVVDLIAALPASISTNPTIATFGRLDVVVLNAAWLYYESVHDMTEESYLEAFDTNVKGPMFFAKLAHPHLAKAQSTPVPNTAGGARIITVSTTLTSLSLVQGDHFLYCATKGALEQVTRTLAKDKSFGGSGITVNSVAPGPIDTEGLRQDIKDEAALGFFASLHPEGRLGEVGDVAGVVGFLASDAARWVNGQVLRINGGMAV